MSKINKSIWGKFGEIQGIGGKVLSFLDEIIENRKKSIKNIIDNYKVAKKIPRESGKFYNSIKNRSNVSIISEVKFASPSMGDIKEKSSIEKIVNAMESGGVIGFSVLTEPNYFKGSPDYLIIVREKSQKPILMKDFFLHESQLYFAADLGANMVLIIASILNKNQISNFIDLSRKLNLETLIEVHDKDDINKIKGLDCKIIGINNRNLTDFSINIETTKKLIPNIRQEFPNSVIISESGIKSRKDVQFIVDAGADAILIGTSIMQAPDITLKIIELKGEPIG
ncbi:MAG: indole-3-glycerol-phosphate synthase [Candidatus Lokiarchaeota archaeon]|nr:indole-3-glycerol-phosphate synthase [Candidatus Lokiarchaeota archaeon]